MANKREPIITFTEIICLAIRSIDSDIESWRERVQTDFNAFHEFTAPLHRKRDALKQMYRNETGVDYE